MRLARAVIWRFLGGQLADLCWTMHWRWAGHLARYSDEYPPKAASLWMGYSSFFTFRQLFNFRMPDTRRVWRWETPVFSFCQTNAWTSCLVGSLFQNQHWSTLAQDREFWQALERNFVRLHAVNPRSDRIALESEPTPDV